jgi:NAD(P)H-flavin reductase
MSEQTGATAKRPTYEPGTRNPYLPMPARVIEVITETPTIKTFRVVLEDEQMMRDFAFQPGQVGQLSMFGSGESTFVINSPPTRKEYLQFSVMRAGENTAALHTLQAGDVVGVRAPLGNCFPYDTMKGKDIVFIGGGIGMAPLRTLLLFMLDNRKDYGVIRLLYGARSPQDMAFSSELPDWLGRKDLECTLTIDREAEGWQHKVGLIPNVLLEMNPDPKNCIALTCGPPIMIKFTLQALAKLKFAPEQIYTTLEKRMKCGIGICGRCNIGGKYVCIDGPVFSMAELNTMPNEL